MSSVIVFSKDRPMQLHAYLESMLVFSDIEENHISIIYVESENISYEKVKNKFSYAKWIKQSDFYLDTLSCIQIAEAEVMFGCDDVVFTGPFSIKIAEEILRNEASIWGFSMRLGRNIEPFPSQAISSKDLCIWEWTTAENPHFAYPWELDCTVYRKEDVIKIMTQISADLLRNPNDLEAIPANNAHWMITKKRMCSYVHSKAIVITVNRVQDEYPNVYDDTKKTDVQTLADLYSKGKTLDVERISKLSLNTNQIHVGADFFILRDDEHIVNVSSPNEFEKDKQCYTEMAKVLHEKDFLINDKYDFPCMNDRGENAGLLDAHYFLQDIYVAKEIYQSKPEIHYDIGRRVDGFIAHLLSFQKKVIMIDIRPLPYKIEGLAFFQGDACSLENIQNESIESLSSLHAIEHFGLGRYGDPIDPNGWRKAVLSMQRVMKKNGLLYISVPIGTENRLYFNAHRMFDIMTIPKILKEMDLIKFAYIEAYQVKNILPRDMQNYKIGSDYLCGIYVFKKR